MRASASRARVVVTLLVCLTSGTVACTGDSDREQIAKVLETATSSGAALEMALASWLANRVPTAFATRAVRESRQMLEQAARSAAALPGGAPAAQLVHDVLAIAPTGDAVARGDTAGVRACVPELAARVRTLRAARDSARSAGS